MFSAAHVHDVLIIGSGFGGLCAAIQLRKAGVQDLVIAERAHEIGGTWRDNTYPGCACDIPSHLYSYSFAPKKDWTRPFPSQSEIQRYLLDIVACFGLRPLIRFGTDIDSNQWQAELGLWRLLTSDGQEIRARHVIAAPGPLNKISMPDIPGRESFAGIQMHSGAWDHSADLRGKRIAVIGTGASAIQIVPELIKTAAHLSVFQRTPAWIVPRPNHAYGPLRRWAYRHVPGLQRLNRWRIYALNELTTASFMGNRVVRGLIRLLTETQLQRQVRDPVLREQLRPHYEPGCKRLAVNDDFYPALQQPLASLVTQAITHIEPDAIVTTDGQRHAVDAIIWCTGFRVTEYIDKNWRIHGEDDVDLGTLWRTQPARAHLGMHVTGFPNMHLIIGPNTGLGSNSIIFMIEAQVRYIVQAVRHSLHTGRALRLKPQAQEASYRAVQALVPRTVWLSGCGSYYLDTHASGTPRLDTLWPSYTTRYWWLTRRFDPALYE